MKISPYIPINSHLSTPNPIYPNKMPTVVQINLQATTEASVKVVEIIGELDESNLSELESFLNPLVADEGNKKIILKLNGLEFMSSKIIGYLASIYNKLNGTDRQMIFAGCNKTIDDILSIVGLNQMIPCLHTVEEALSMTNVQ